jgi:hypothetical protein
MPNIFNLGRRLRDQMGEDYCFGMSGWVDADLIMFWLQLTRRPYWRRHRLCSACIAEIETLAGIDDITKLDFRTRAARELIVSIQQRYFNSDEYYGDHLEDALGW